MRFVDEALEQRARGRLFRKIVFDQLVSFFFEERDRVPATRSTRFEVDLELFRHHFFLSHQAFAFSLESFAGGAGAAARFGARSAIIS